MNHLSDRRKIEAMEKYFVNMTTLKTSLDIKTETEMTTRIVTTKSPTVLTQAYVRTSTSRTTNMTKQILTPMIILTHTMNHI